MSSKNTLLDSFSCFQIFSFSVNSKRASKIELSIIKLLGTEFIISHTFLLLVMENLKKYHNKGDFAGLCSILLHYHTHINGGSRGGGGGGGWWGWGGGGGWGGTRGTCPPPPSPSIYKFITFRAAFYNNSCTLVLPIDTRTHEFYYCTISRTPRYAIIPPPPL